MPAAIQAVVFDLDDTLYPERDHVRSGYQAVSNHLQQARGRSEPFGEWLWRRFCSGETEGAFDALNEHFELGLSADEIARLVEVYRTHVPRIEPYEGVGEFLADLQERAALGLLSDGYLPAQQLKLDALGLAGHFRQVLFTESLGRDSWKPSPAGFERIAHLLAAGHDACCYVADNPAKDFLAPNRLGWRTVQLRWPGQIHADRPAPAGGAPQHVALSLTALAALLS